MRLHGTAASFQIALHEDEMVLEAIVSMLLISLRSARTLLRWHFDVPLRRVTS